MSARARRGGPPPPPPDPAPLPALLYHATLHYGGGHVILTASRPDQAFVGGPGVLSLAAYSSGEHVASVLLERVAAAALGRALLAAAAALELPAEGVPELGQGAPS